MRNAIHFAKGNSYVENFQELQSTQNGHHWIAGRGVVLFYAHPDGSFGCVGIGVADRLSGLRALPRVVYLFGIDRIWVLPSIER